MKKFFKTLIVLTGTSLGFAVARLIVDIIQRYYADIVQDQGYWIRPALYAGLMTVGTLVFLIFSEKWASGLVRFISDTEEGISKASYRTVLFNTAGIAIGIIIAFFFSHIVSRLGEGPFVFFIDIIIYVVFVYLSVIVATKLSKAKRKNIMSEAEDEEMERKPETYFVDTSSLIDGRLYMIFFQRELSKEISSFRASYFPNFRTSQIRRMTSGVKRAGEVLIYSTGWYQVSMRLRLWQRWRTISPMTGTISICRLSIWQNRTEEG